MKILVRLEAEKLGDHTS